RLGLVAAGPGAAAAHGKGATRVREIALELLALVEERLDALRGFGRAGSERGGDLAQRLFLLAHKGFGAGTGDDLDAAEAGADRALAHDLEQSDVAGAAHMGAAAELGREMRLAAGIVAHRDDAHLVA